MWSGKYSVDRLLGELTVPRWMPLISLAPAHPLSPVSRAGGVHANSAAAVAGAVAVAVAVHTRSVGHHMHPGLY